MNISNEYFLKIIENRKFFLINQKGAFYTITKANRIFLIAKKGNYKQLKASIIKRRANIEFIKDKNNLTFLLISYNNKYTYKSIRKLLIKNNFKLRNHKRINEFKKGEIIKNETH